MKGSRSDWYLALFTSTKISINAAVAAAANHGRASSNATSPYATIHTPAWTAHALTGRLNEGLGVSKHSRPKDATSPTASASHTMYLSPIAGPTHNAVRYGRGQNGQPPCAPVQWKREADARFVALQAPADVLSRSLGCPHPRLGAWHGVTHG